MGDVSAKAQVLEYQKQVLVDKCVECVGCDQVDVRNCIEWNCNVIWPRKVAQKTCDILVPELTAINKAIKDFELESTL